MEKILEEIINNKMREVAQKKINRDFLRSTINPKVGDISIIAEIKLASPSAGKLGDVSNIRKKVKEYEKGFVDAISVVVDKRYFSGNLDFIRQIKDTVSLPVLAKDFVIDSFQIYEMKVFGADAILLIAKILSREQLKEFVDLAFESGLEPVVEVQNKKELENAINTNARIIAVNARDLTTFDVNIEKACELIKDIPNKFVSLGFSGVSGIKEVEKYKKAGTKGVLVGTSLMKTNNIGKLIKELKNL